MDKRELLYFMRMKCYGHENAKKREQLLKDTNLEDRRFRQLFSELLHERHVISDSIHGYWFIKLKCDRQEAEAVLNAIKERKSKALDMLTGLKAFEQEILAVRTRKEDKDYLVSVRDGQMSFVGV